MTVINLLKNISLLIDQLSFNTHNMSFFATRGLYYLTRMEIEKHITVMVDVNK